MNDNLNIQKMPAHSLVLLKYLSWRFVTKRNELFFALCLIIAASLMSTLGFFSINVQKTLNNDIAQFLGAPLVISSQQQLPEQWWTATTSQTTIASPAITASFTYGAIGTKGYRTIALKGVSKNYPLQKPLIISTADNQQENGTAQTLKPGEAWLDRRAMLDLGVTFGDRIQVGKHHLTVAAEIVQEPDRLTQLQHLLPRVLVGFNDLQAIGIKDSHISSDYRYLFDDEPHMLENFKRFLPKLIAQKHQIITPDDGNHPFARMAQRAEKMMGFVMILIMLMCGSAAAILANKSINQFVKPAAILRCLGIKKQAFTMAILLQLTALVVVSCIFGNIIGWAAQPLLAQILTPHLIISEHVFNISVPMMTLMITLLTIYAFIVPKLISLSELSIVKVLRGEQELSKKMLLSNFSILAAIFTFLWYFSDNIRLTSYLFIGIVGMVLIAMLLGWLINKFTTQFHHLSRGSIKVMLRSLGRNPIKHMGSMTTIAVSVMAIIMINTLRGSFVDAFHLQRLSNDGQLLFSQLPQKAQQNFLKFSENNNLTIKGIYPTISAQLVAINNKTLDQAISQASDSREELRSPVKLSWSIDTPHNNAMLEGKWPKNAKEGVSVEQEVMSDLGLNMGDQLTFNINGQTLNTTITSRRSFKSGGSRFMFWFMFSADALTPYAHHYMGGVEFNNKDSNQQLQLISELNRHYPQVLFVNLSDIIERTASIMQAITTVMYVLLMVLLIAALTVISASTLVNVNLKEHHLMRTLGLSQWRIYLMTITQQGLIGFASCLIGIITAQMIAGLIFDQMFAMEYQPDWLQNTIIMSSTTLCFVLFGLLLSIKTQKQAQASTLQIN